MQQGTAQSFGLTAKQAAKVRLRPLIGDEGTGDKAFIFGKVALAGLVLQSSTPAMPREAWTLSKAA